MYDGADQIGLPLIIGANTGPGDGDRSPIFIPALKLLVLLFLDGLSPASKNF
jgi:hypothetical protein